MKGAGKDCTALFDKYHKWVNCESILGKCLLGVLADESVTSITEVEEEEEEVEVEEEDVDEDGDKNCKVEKDELTHCCSFIAPSEDSEQKLCASNEITEDLLNIEERSFTALTLENQSNKK